MGATTRIASVVLVVPAVVVALGAGAPAPTAPPAEVEIAALSDWFAPVVLPHAAHAELTGDCTGCHHHSDGEPVSCATCHAAGAAAADGPPPLRVAYHRQCVGCHEEAGAPTTCEGCHPRKRLPRGPALGPAAR